MMSDQNVINKICGLYFWHLEEEQKKFLLGVIGGILYHVYIQ